MHVFIILVNQNIQVHILKIKEHSKLTSITVSFESSRLFSWPHSSCSKSVSRRTLICLVLPNVEMLTNILSTNFRMPMYVSLDLNTVKIEYIKIDSKWFVFSENSPSMSSQKSRDVKISSDYHYHLLLVE